MHNILNNLENKDEQVRDCFSENSKNLREIYLAGHFIINDK